jgi:hypothetical protein
MGEEISYYTRLYFIPTSTMGLITKEIDYDHQLKQLTSEMTVTAN